MSYSLVVPYSQAASLTTPNILAGTAVEYMGEAAILTIYGSADLATSRDTAALSSFQGSKPGSFHVPTSQIPLASTPGAVKTNENFLARVSIPAGSRLVMAVVSDATAGTHTGRFLFVVE